MLGKVVEFSSSNTETGSPGLLQREETQRLYIKQRQKVKYSFWKKRVRTCWRYAKMLGYICMNYEVRQQFIETLAGECWREQFFKGTCFQILIMLLFINAKFYQISPLFAACSSPATLKMICRGRDSWNQHGAGMTRGAPIESVQKTAKQTSGYYQGVLVIPCSILNLHLYFDKSYNNLMPFTFPVLMVVILIKWSFQSVTSATPLQRASNGPIIWRKGTSKDRIGTTQILKTGNVAAIESIISWWKSLLSTPGLFHSVAAATSLPFLRFFS